MKKAKGLTCEERVAAALDEAVPEGDRFTQFFTPEQAQRMNEQLRAAGWGPEWYIQPGEHRMTRAAAITPELMNKVAEAIGCSVCGKTGKLFKCSGCGSNTRYCSKNCQTQDWKNHKENEHK
jgi:hypothetical protein